MTMMMTLTMTLCSMTPTTLLLRGRLKKTKMKKTALRGHGGRRDRCHHDDDDIEDDINDDDGAYIFVHTERDDEQSSYTSSF